MSEAKFLDVFKTDYRGVDMISFLVVSTPIFVVFKLVCGLLLTVPNCVEARSILGVHGYTRTDEPEHTVSTTPYFHVLKCVSPFLSVFRCLNVILST